MLESAKGNVKNVLVATSNKTKIEEYRAIFAMEFPNIRLLTPDDVDIDMSTIDEYGGTYSVNSFIKAEESLKLLDESRIARINYYLDEMIVIGDDAGYSIKQFNWMPNIFTHRLLDKYSVNNLDTNKSMVAHQDCAVTVMTHGVAVTRMESVWGKITPEGNETYGSYYMNYFIPDGYDRPFSRLGMATIIKESARAKAIKECLNILFEKFL